MFLLMLYLRRRRARTLAAGGAAATRSTPSHPANTLMLVLHQARYDLQGFLRNRQARFFTLLLPLLFLVIFVGVFGNHVVGPGQVKASTYYVPGIAALAIIAASFVNLVISITAQREAGVLKRRRATPVPAWVLIAARALTAVATSLSVMTVLLLVGRFAYGAHLAVAAIPGVALTAIVGSITFCVLGYALVTVVGNADSAQPITQAVMLPLYFISGVFVPSVNLPDWLHHIASFFPVEHLADALHRAYVPGAGSGIVWSDLGVMALWIAAGLIVALRRFSWTPAVSTA
jgi:ABC-2 type transport system permease protein